MEPLLVDSKLLFALGGWTGMEKGLGFGEVGLGFGEIGLQAEGFLKVRGRLRDIAFFRENDAPAILRLGIGWIERERDLVLGDGLVLAGSLGKGLAEIVMKWSEPRL